MGRLTTHVLDTSAGRPAAGLVLELFALDRDGGRSLVTWRLTNADGRTDLPLLDADTYQPGTYELVFHVGDHFRTTGAQASDPPFLDLVPLRFTLGADGHYHVPLLCSPWSYSTYRGS
ncbi:hydroxyisourate hydrolase [Xanthobacteraceae bacterium A53D]